jgi:hypothetical protein
MRGEVLDPGAQGSGLHDMPNRLWRDPFAPDLAEPVDAPEDPARADVGSLGPFVDGSLWPKRGPERCGCACPCRLDRQSRNVRPESASPRSSGRVVSKDEFCSSVLDWSIVSPILLPRRFAPLTRRIPAASSGLSRPVSAASKASRRTAAKRTLMVEERDCSAPGRIATGGPQSG